MAELKSSEAGMNMTIHITRAEAGLTKPHELICTPIESTKGA